MRYKFPRPKGLPDPASLALLEIQVEIYRKMRGDQPLYPTAIRNEALGAVLQLGTAYHFRGEDEKAIAELEDYAAHSTRGNGPRYLAVSYERLHRYGEAIDAHRRAIDSTPTSAFHLGHLGRLLCLDGKDAEALPVLQAGQASAPNDPHVRARLASVRSRLRPDEFDDKRRRPAYSIVVVLGDRVNFSTYQTLLESLYRRMHKLILVVDSQDVEDRVSSRGDGRLDLKAWLRRHPGVEVNNHARIHLRRLPTVSRLLGRAFVATDRRPGVASVSRELRDWTGKVAADLMLVCVDRCDPLFVEPYVEAAVDAGYLVCGIGTSERITAIEARLDRSIPRIRCIPGDAEQLEGEVSLSGSSIVVRGDLMLEAAYRLRPDKEDLTIFDQDFPTLAGRPFVLYLADPSAAPQDELVRAATLAARLRQSNRLGVRRLAVVYRSARPSRPPVQVPIPDNLVVWPRPDISQDSNTAAMLRAGLYRAATVVSPSAGELSPAVMADRPAIVLRTDGAPVAANDPRQGGMYRCRSLGELVHLLGDLVDGRDPLADGRAAFMVASDLSRRSRFHDLGELLGFAVEHVAGGASVDQVSRLLQSEIEEAQGPVAGVATGQSGADRLRWVEAADRALAAVGSSLRVAPEFRDNPAPSWPEVEADLEAAAAQVCALERSGLIGKVSDGLIGQILGGTVDPAGQLQSALLLKAIFPGTRIYLLDTEARYADVEPAVTAVFPDARIVDALEELPGKTIGSLDFVYTIDKRVAESHPRVPSLVIAPSAVCYLPDIRLLTLANRLAAWDVPILVIAVDAKHPRAARFAQVSAVLHRSFRLSDLSEPVAGRYLTSVAVSRAAVMRSLTVEGGSTVPIKALGRPSVTVGLVVYNGAGTLAESLDTILSQTYWDFEVIVVDNGSTDATLEVARAYAERDPRISLYPRRKNVGAVGNFRFALSLARGRYFCWASDHDLYDRVWLERMVAALESRPNAALAYPYFGMIDDRGVRVGDHLTRFDTSGRGIAQRMRLVTDRMRGSGSKVYGLYRRAALERVRVRTTVWWDRLFLLELAAVGEFVQVNEVLWWRRYKGVKREAVEPPDVGKFGLIPTPLTTTETVIRQLNISFEDGRAPFLMRMATLANAVLLIWDVALAPPGRRVGASLAMLPLAIRSAYRAMVRTKAFIPAEFEALRQHVLGRR
ncbi:glycosyltransferase [Thalassobaculum sp.]|uniref:glycosyltransferase family 2 protein n=1 Tax=Thalassobaculum sp. TaxID=2022740 RepID=UPI0032EF097D